MDLRPPRGRRIRKFIGRRRQHLPRLLPYRISAGETVTAEKVAAIQVGAAEAAAGKNTLVLWINLEYEESLVREFCAVTGLNYGELTSSAIGSTIPLSADLRFTFYAAAGDHGAQNSDIL